MRPSGPDAEGTACPATERHPAMRAATSTTITDPHLPMKASLTSDRPNEEKPKGLAGRPLDRPDESLGPTRRA